MNVMNVHVKELQIIKQRVEIEIEKLLRSSMDDNGDEGAQFQADPFIADQFYMAWPRQKLPKELAKGPTEAVIFRGKHQSSLSPFKMDNNHNRQDCAKTEDDVCSVSNISPSPTLIETKVEPVDLTEVKTKELDSLLKESFDAYTLSQYGLAVTKYKMAWEMLTDSTLKLHVDHVNVDMVCYMLCLSLLETDSLNNLLEAVELLNTLEKRSSHVFPAVYYALGKAHHKHYRFSMALEAVEAGLAILESVDELIEYTIPGSELTLMESTKDGLMLSLAAMKDECSKWHQPDAVCRMGECLPSSRWYGPNRNIYFSDPGFNGMVVLTCSNSKYSCTMSFHQTCWKAKKEQLSSVGKFSDKDIIGHECFTPDCEYGEGTRSVITGVDIYGSDGKLKTHIEPPANPVVRTKRQPSSKGAIPKQPVKPKRLWEKPRRVVVAALPRSSSKEVTNENRDDKEWRLAKLAKLRKTNFGIKPDCEWRPDMEMYGNPQMMEVGDFLGGPIFENNSPELTAIKKFIFSYFYEFIKENGCVKKEQILQKWVDDKIIFDNASEVLDGESDICDFLLQSYKLVSLGDRISTAENLPELYALVRKEICHCVRFALTDPLQAQPAITHAIDDTSKMLNNRYDPETNEFIPSFGNSDTKIDKMETKTFDHLEQEREPEISDADLLQMIWSNREYPENLSPNYVSPFAKPESLNDPMESTPPFIWDYRFIVNNEPKIDGISDPSPNYSSHFDTQNIPNDNVVGDEEYPAETVVDAKEMILPVVSSLSQESELTDDMQERVVDEEFHINSSDIENFELDNGTDCLTETNRGEEEVKLLSDATVGESEFTIKTNNEDSDATQFNGELANVENNYVVDTEVHKDIAGETQDCVVSTVGIEIAKTTEEIPSFSTSQRQDSLAESNVQKIENDLAIMVKTVAQFKSVLEQNQARSENHAQMLQQELMNYKMVSQESMSELVKDLSRLEARCARLDTEKSELMDKLEKRELDLSQINDENVILRLKNTEWMHKYDKLTDEKAEMEHNFELLMKEKSVIENNLETLQRERDKMDKKLQKYSARLKEKNDIEQALLAQKVEIQSEQQILEATRLSERKLKLQSLNQEFSINKYALEKALEKCYDQVNMLNEVSHLIAMITGQQFIMAETQAAWRETDYHLRRKIGHYEEEYLKVKILLESDEQIENLNSVKLPVLNIQNIFPKPANLRELFYKERQFMHPPMPGLPGAYCVDPRFIPPPFYHGQNLHPRMKEPRDPAAVPAYPNSHRPRGPNDNVNGAGLPRETSSERQKFDGRFVHDDSSIHEAEKDDKGASQERQSADPPKKIGRDMLVQELRKKFVGVPEYDLIESLQRVRKRHNNTLSGMRLQDIMKEADPLVKQSQAKHLAYYLPSKPSLPPQRISQQPNKPNQRKLASSMQSGQQNKIRDTAQDQINKPESYQTRVRTSSPAGMKKSAWAPVSSGLAEWKKKEEESECGICSDRMNLYPVYTLPCQHSFHMKCIKDWLGVNSTCPICRMHCTMDDEFPPLPS